MIGNDPFESGTRSDLTGRKSPMEDFLFIQVIALAVALSMFAQKQMADQFALPERIPGAEAISHEQYDELPKCELPDDGTYMVFQGRRVDSLDELKQIVLASVGERVVLKVSRDRTVGDVEDIKNVFLSQGIDLLTEWETRHED